MISAVASTQSTSGRRANVCSMWLMCRGPTPHQNKLLWYVLGPLVLTRIANNPTLRRVQIREFSSTPGDRARSVPVGDGNIRANDSQHRQLQIPCIGMVVRPRVPLTDDVERHGTARISDLEAANFNSTTPEPGLSRDNGRMEADTRRMSTAICTGVCRLS